MTPPDVSVVIVSHNHAQYLDACLQSLAPERHVIVTEVFVVDNVSTDGAAELVGRRYPWARLLRNTRRLGFAANNNKAIRESRGRYVLLLNPDTAVADGALEALVWYMDTHPRVGLCGPRLVFPSGALQLSARRFPTLGSVIARRSPLRMWLRNSESNKRHLMADVDHATCRPVDWLLGAAVLSRREMLRTVGLLDEGYFLYVEDIDWAYRAWQQGWQVVYYPDAQVMHHHLAESDRALWSRQSWQHVRSMWRYYRKHLAPRWLRLSVDAERLP